MALSDRYSDQVAPAANSSSAPVDRWARRFFVSGSVIFILVGLVHTVTQLTTLSSPEVKTAYRAGGLIEVSGTTADGWELFAGISVLMGLYGIVFGAANLVTLQRTPRADGLPPAGTCVVNLAMLAAIAVVGFLYLGPPQIAGGLVGLVLFGLPLWRVTAA